MLRILEARAALWLCGGLLLALAWLLYSSFGVPGFLTLVLVAALGAGTYLYLWMGARG